LEEFLFHCSNPTTGCEEEFGKYFCTFGCHSGDCTYSYGLCCDRRVISAGVSSDGSDDCHNECGELRSQTPSRASGKRISTRPGGRDALSGDDRVFVPDRCAHYYGILDIDRGSSRVKGM
jgi:hypothetical protein